MIRTSTQPGFITQHVKDGAKSVRISWRLGEEPSLLILLKGMDEMFVQEVAEVVRRHPLAEPPVGLSPCLDHVVVVVTVDEPFGFSRYRPVNAAWKPSGLSHRPGQAGYQERCEYEDEHTVHVFLFLEMPRKIPHVC